ncbi:MAG TPA: biotin/lipoyl-containing protein [Nocardioidaceae bacterium]|nr:biotin/lipoyl-containing protein [Nocardioidaceae bacterium]
MLTPEDLNDIVRILDSTTLDELHVETSQLSITLRRHGAHGEWTAESELTRAPAHHLTHRGEEDERHVASSMTGAGGESVVGSAESEGLHAVKPPLLGTFYRSPKPGAAPFVDVGSTVEADTVVGIVETMKMMNSVYAGVTGVVKRICLDDAQYADTDTALMLIEENG